MTDHGTDAPRIAIVGSTGLVGQEMLHLLEQRGFPMRELRLLASTSSAGRRVPFRGEPITIEPLTPDALAGIDLALFAVDSALSERYGPIAVGHGATVVDNSSRFRMSGDVPLVIPEVNGDVLDGDHGPRIIANPNCSTIIALMAVTPLHRAAGVRRMVVSTYQAASGGGTAMLRELEGQVEDHAAGRPYRQDLLDRPYLFNLFSHDSAVGPEGYNKEEMKLVLETRKIWGDEKVAITATCVRVPVLRAHTESINMTFDRPLPEAEARAVLAAAPGVRIVDDRATNRFPEPVDASGGDDVLVGRIRGDISQEPDRGLDLLVCGDQIRKGAALNAVQIAERL
jgi:aspartate-semialdehyde dehydrogenase